VVDSRNNVIGIVDVLKLTYATLEQINQMNAPEGEGPMWNRFWNTLDNDTESVHSGDGISAVHSQRPESPSHVRGLSGDPTLHRLASDSLLPTDSASIAAVQDEVFKFKSPAGRVHRLRFDSSAGLSEFRNAIAEKLTSDEKAVIGDVVAEDAGFAISFADDEGDIVSILSIADLADSVSIAKRTGRDKVDLYVHHPNQPPHIEPPSTVARTPDIVVETAQKVEQVAERAPEKVKEVISRIPNELLLPGAIVVLAAVIVGVFVAARAGSAKLR